MASGIDSKFGGYTISIGRGSTSGQFGGYTISHVLMSGVFGGFAISSYSDTTFTITEAGARGLIKAKSDSVYRQAFKTDAEFFFYAYGTSEFDAEIIVEDRFRDEFDALLSTIKVHRNPYVQFISVPITSGHIPRTVTVTASGFAYNKNNQAINSGIHYVAFVWSDNDYTVITTPRASGSVWSATHTYIASGLYRPIVIVRDKFGRTGSDYAKITAMSGNIGVPYIALSGIPRFDTVPPPLAVNFNVQLSGVDGAYTIYWDYGNGVTYYNNALNQNIQYALPGDYIPYVRIRDQRQINICDTLRVGFNK
jgi:hypothetical protein